MRPLTFLASLAGLASLARAHMVFARVAHNGEWQIPTRFIRNRTAPFVDPWTRPNFVARRLYVDPTYATDLPESVRCGRDNLAHSAGTEVLPVRAGDTLEFLSFPFPPTNWSTYTEVPDVQWENCPDNRGGCSKQRPSLFSVVHDGPVVAHLSRVPDGTDIHSYDGSGEWVKIYSMGLKIRPDGTWYWLPRNNYEGSPKFIIKIPTTTPSGKYLIRVDQIWPFAKELHSPPQLYPSCAQIEVTGSAEGQLPKGIRIPEDLADESQGMLMSQDMWDLKKIDKGYVYPGGPLWDGERLIEDKAPQSSEAQ